MMDIPKLALSYFPAWLRILVLTALGVLISIGLGKFAISHGEMLVQATIMFAVLLPGFILASGDSPRLIPYIMLVWVVSPEIRRLYDWMNGQYSTLSILTLTPLLATGLLVFAIFREKVVLAKPAARIFKAYLAPYIYAAGVGILLNKMAGIYGVGNYVLPLAILLYLLAKPPSEERKTGWIRSYVAMAVLLSAYAWIQYLVLPPWDRFWMEGASMASLGIPEPLSFRPFSTLNATATLAIFLVSALVPAIVSKAYRKPFGWPGIVLIISALSVTLVRGSWVTLIVCLVAYVLLASGASRFRMLAAIVFLSGAAYFVFPYLPGGASMADRVSTFGSLDEDTSANARIGIVLHTLPQLAVHPFGTGFGGIGRSAMLDGGSTFSGLGSVDNGYLGIFATFGLIGGVLFFRALYRHWKLIAGGIRTNGTRVLGLLMIVNLLASFLFGGEINGIGAVIFWLFTGMALPAREET
ncbi:O-antigen ligase [Cohnella sp. GbtcB17]|uniref:O-antigen ligase family protein n=1 Tax=Cohnella sp. GbtcB17 TaxID=2824762 RepID=UPI001C3060D4|nr:O-antigen ligase family protein [Cohnella sp. GbtcB17]